MYALHSVFFCFLLFPSNEKCHGTILINLSILLFFMWCSTNPLSKIYSILIQLLVKISVLEYIFIRRFLVALLRLLWIFFFMWRTDKNVDDLSWFMFVTTFSIRPSLSVIKLRKNFCLHIFFFSAFRKSFSRWLKRYLIWKSILKFCWNKKKKGKIYV